jgi:hypothetical protein
MSVVVTLQTVTPRRLAAVRRRINVSGIASAWRPALDQVWAFLRAHPELREGGDDAFHGHNVFLYHHGEGRQAPMDIDFGVQVPRPFEPLGEIINSETPAGQVALAVHVGAYGKLPGTHDAIHAWCAEHHRTIGKQSWEIYGDWTNDESKLETTVAYLLI